MVTQSWLKGTQVLSNQSKCTNIVDVVVGVELMLLVHKDAIQPDI